MVVEVVAARPMGGAGGIMVIIPNIWGMMKMLGIGIVAGRRMLLAAVRVGKGLPAMLVVISGLALVAAKLRYRGRDCEVGRSAAGICNRV